MEKNVEVITKTVVTYDGSYTEVYGVFNDEGLALRKLRELIKNDFDDKLTEFQDDVEYDGEGDADEMFNDWIDDYWNCPTIWSYDDNDGMEITYIIHTTTIE